MKEDSFGQTELCDVRRDGFEVSTLHLAGRGGYLFLGDLHGLILK
jgi:hypothetical protein